MMKTNTNWIVSTGIIGVVGFYMLRQRAIDWARKNIPETESKAVDARLVLKADFAVPYPQLHWDIYVDGTNVGTVDLFSKAFFEVTIA